MADVLFSLAGSGGSGVMMYLTLGLMLIFFGFSYLIPRVARVEPDLVQYLQGRLNNKPFLQIFKELWNFGRTPFTIIVLVFMTCIDWKMGLTASGIFFNTAGIELLLKRILKRSRPFTSHPTIAMLQPVEPLDQSFPSGDVLRAWYLAILVSAVSGSSPAVWAAATILAGLITLGRIVMGVHYLTDTLAGAGLGVLGAGTTLWVWSLLNII
jgi:membrane-associated phospholipid phosphatase